MSTAKVILTGSERQPIGTRVGDQPNDEMIEVSVILKPKLRSVVPRGGGCGRFTRRIRGQARRR